MSVTNQIPASDESKPLEHKRGSLQDDVIRILQSKGASIPQRKAREIAVTIATKFSGPIPPPNLLAEYEAVLPGCAERIMNAFESQSNHRMALEVKAISAQLRQSQIGQVLGGIIVISCLGISAWMGYLGNTWLASTLGTTTVVGLATIYFLGKRSVDRSLRSKSNKPGSAK